MTQMIMINDHDNTAYAVCELVVIVKFQMKMKMESIVFCLVLNIRI